MITILRLGHRPDRDRRVTTHLGLVGRAFGASKLILTGPDSRIDESIVGVNKNFGGEFSVEFINNWRAFLSKWKGTVVHLTMYGVHIDDCLDEIRSAEDVLVVVGSQKMPREVFEKADMNIAVGHQPHSEVAALAIFLDRCLEGRGLRRSFDGSITIHPSQEGKEVEIIQQRNAEDS